MPRFNKSKRQRFFIRFSYRDAETGEWVAECNYCYSKLNFHQVTIDHVLARGMGGSNRVENKVPCCPSCNSRKSRFESIAANLAEAERQRWAFADDDWKKKQRESLARLMKDWHNSIQKWKRAKGK